MYVLKRYKMQTNIQQFKRNILAVLVASSSTSGLYASEIRDADQKNQMLELETLVLQAEDPSSLQKAQEVLAKVPGGTYLVSSTQLELATGSGNSG